MAVMRLFVEKAPGFDIEAQGVLSDLREFSVSRMWILSMTRHSPSLPT